MVFNVVHQGPWLNIVLIAVNLVDTVKEVTFKDELPGNLSHRCLLADTGRTNQIEIFPFGSFLSFGNVNDKLDQFVDFSFSTDCWSIVVGCYEVVW